MSQFIPEASSRPRLPIRLTEPAGGSIWASRPYRYSQDPLKLFFEDAITFGNVLWTILDIARPWNAKDDGDVELCNSWRGRRDDFLVFGISVLQIVMLPTAILGMLLLPGFLAILLIGFMSAFTWLTLYPVQGPRLVESKVDLSSNGDALDRSNSREKWIFINGVMVHHIGLQSAVDAIARVFKRPVLGIHNVTTGFFGDVLECLMQRCFAYSTIDVRFAYQEIFDHITNPNIDKIVLIAHSQGGTIASLVVDRLCCELPQEIVGKLEIFTFGSAAAHFNNPSHRHLSPYLEPNTQEARSLDILNIFNEAGDSSNLSTFLSGRQQDDHVDGPMATSSIMKACPDHVILNIEHYANEHDPIPRWGFLRAYKDLFDSRYTGKLFVRRGASGHFFTSHYLAAWFPLDAASADRVKNQEVAVFCPSMASDNGILGTTGLRRQTYESTIEEGVHMEWGNNQPASRADLERMEAARKQLGEGQFYVLGSTPQYSNKMQRISRLWQYVDGGRPSQ